MMSTAPEILKTEKVIQIKTKLYQEPLPGASILL